MDFFKEYFRYVGATESPAIYHRWTAISCLGALLGRQVHLPFGHGTIYPNQYIMLMGSPGTRKGTSMNIGAKLIKAAGYSRFCPDRLSKERFLMEMKPYNSEELLPDADLETLVVDSPSEVYVVAEEFTDFVGQGGMEFMTMLTKLWDNMSIYTHPKIHGKSIVVDKPTVNIYGGNTVQGLALAIPPEALGNGFMSRMIFVYSDPTSKKITFPPPVNTDLRADLVEYLREMRDELKGEMCYTDGSKLLLDKIYRGFVEIDDLRFKHYTTRRFTHLLKLSIIIAASRLSMVIDEEIVIHANTVLAAAERRMPKALGEFGKSKYSEVSNSIIDILHKAIKPLSINDIFKKVSKDLTKITELSDIMKSLIYSEKAQVITIAGKQGYMPLHIATKEWESDLIDESILTAEERS